MRWRQGHELRWFTCQGQLSSWYALTSPCEGKAPLPLTGLWHLLSCKLSGYQYLSDGAPPGRVQPLRATPMVPIARSAASATALTRSNDMPPAAAAPATCSHTLILTTACSLPLPLWAHLQPSSTTFCDMSLMTLPKTSVAQTSP